MSWPLVKLASVAEQIRGVTYEKLEATTSPAPGMIPILRASNITETGLALSDLIFVPESRVSPRQILKAGDIVVAASSGSIDVVGKAGQVREPFLGSFGAFCKVIRPSKDIDACYLSHFFQTSRYRNRVSSLAAGANINNLKNEHLNELDIPFPPLEEQQRIAAILDKVEELRTKRRAAIALLNQLPTDIFLEMFGDTRVNPNSYPVVQFERILDPVRGTKCGPFGSALQRHEYVEGGVPVWQIDNVSQLLFSEKNALYITPEKFKELSSYSVVKGDILITRAGTVGKLCVAQPSVRHSIIGTNLIRVSLNHDLAHPVYIAYVLAIYGHSLGRLQANSKDNAYSFMKTGVLRTLQIPLAPLHLQHLFVARVKSADNAKDLQYSALAEVNALFASLQQQAYCRGLKPVKELSIV